MNEIAAQTEVVVRLAQDMGLTALCLLGWQFAWNSYSGLFPRRFDSLLQGLAYGLIGSVSMIAPTAIIPGLIFDMRMPIVALATLFVDPVAGLLTAILQAAVRLLIGGVGAPGAMYGLAVAFGIALAFRLWHRRQDRPITVASLILIGVLIGAISLGSVFFLADKQQMIDIAERVALPIVLVVPIALACLGGILRVAEQRRSLQRRLDESTRLFRIMYNRTPLMLAAVDPAGAISAVSDHWLNVMGYRREEVIGRSRWEFLTPAGAELVQQKLLPRIDQGETLSDVDLELRRRDGSSVLVRAWLTSYPDPATQARRYLVAALDQTAQQAAEHALAEKQRQFSAIMDLAPAAIYLKDRERRYQLVNRGFEQWFSRPSAAVLGRVDEEFAPADVAKLARDSDMEVLRLGRTVQYKRRAYGVANVVSELLVTKFPVKDEAGAAVGICGFMLDITELEHTQLTARAREQELSAILDSAPAAIFLKDMQGRFVRVNRRWEEWIGRKQEEITGLNDADLFGDAIAAHGLATDRQLFETGAAIQFERPAVFNVHGVEHVQVTKFPVRAQDGKLVGVGGIVADITDRVRAETDLRANEARFRALIEYSNDVFVVTDLDGTLRYRSPTQAEGLGYGAASEGLASSELLHPDDAAAYTDARRGILSTPGRVAKGVSRARHKDGSWRWIDWSMRNGLDIPGVNGIIINFRDVTEARRLEEELRQAQKMESIGRLAGGIAHDFNNILGAIGGFTELALSELEPSSRAHGFLSRVATASERAKDLVQQILSFSRRDLVERRPENLSSLVRETLDLLRAALPNSTEIDLRIAAQNVIARVNSTQINQILLNLCQNASHALDGKPGRIAVSLDRVDAQSAAADYQAFEARSDVAGGEDDRLQVIVGSLNQAQAYARLAVTDSSGGMPRQVLERIFDPFFTTKARGRGTGLGLAVVHGIILSHGGACLVASTPGVGTSFTIYLPLTSGAVAAPAPTPEVTSLRGSERIMVIDDEEDICDVLTEGLERLGYSVAAASDATMALEAFTDAPGEWDIAISDQIMPEIKGLTLCAQMKAIKPSLKFILCTGYSDSTTEEKAIEAGADRFLMKPVSINVLAATIRSVIDGPQRIQVT